MKIGFIGFGEAAYNISIGLRKEGVQEIFAFDSMENDVTFGVLIHERAKEANVTLNHTYEELIKNVDIIFCSVPSSYSEEVFHTVKPYIDSTQIYVDVSASTPNVKERIDQEARAYHISYIDAAMLGSLPKDKHKVPILASGEGVQNFVDQMNAVGMNIKRIPGRAGKASAIKLVRSIYMKGLSTLMIEMLEASEAYGVSEEVIHSISTSMDNIPFENHLNRLVTGSAIHALRRAKEVKGSLEMIQEKNIHGYMTQATIYTLEELAEYKFNELFANKKPNSWKDIIDQMK